MDTTDVYLLAFRGDNPLPFHKDLGHLVENLFAFTRTTVEFLVRGFSAIF